MTVSERFLVENYDVEIAQQLIGPANFGSAEPAGFTDHLALIVKNIAVFILRVFNYLCGDHQWYNNHTARQIILDHIATGSQSNSTLSQRVLQLYQDLGLRANGNTSWTEGIHRSSLPYREQTSTLPVIGEAAGNPSSSPAVQMLLLREFPSRIDSPMILHQLPPEMRLKVFKQLDAPSLLRLLSTNTQTHCFIKSDHRLISEILLEVAMNKMLHIAEGMQDTDGYPQKSMYMVDIVKAQALTNPERALETANLIQSTGSKKTAIAEVAQSYALTNPDLALTTLNLAGFNPSTKDGYLADIAKKQASHALPQEALATANLILDPYDKINALIAIAKRQTLLGSEQAEDLFRQLQLVACDDHEKLITLLKIVKTCPLINANQDHEIFRQIAALVSSTSLHQKELNILTLVNPQQARDYAVRIQDSTRRDGDLCLIAKKQALVNPVEARVTASLINSNFLKAEVLCKLSKALAPVNQELANEFLQEASDAAELIQNDDQSKAIARCWITSVQAMIHPDQIPNLVHDLHDQLSNTIHMGRVCYEAEKALCQISKMQALRNPEQALLTANLINNRVTKAIAFGRIAKIQARIDKVKANDIFVQAIMIVEQEEQASQVDEARTARENAGLLGIIMRDIIAVR